MVYVHLDWFVYLKNAMEAKEHVYMCICHFEYNNLKSLVTHNHLPQECD